MADALIVLLVIVTELLGGLALALARSGRALPVVPGGHGWSQPVPPPVPDEAESSRNRRIYGRNTAIIERLKSGALVGSQRNIARQLGLPVTTLRNVVETDPRVRLVASREGSRLELSS